MSTSYKQVFDRFLKLIDDRTLCELLNDEDMTDLLESFLNGAQSIYFKNCKKNLKDKENPEFYSEEFTGDGTTNEFTISQYPINPNEESLKLYCKVNDEDVDFTFDSDTLQFTTNDIPETDDNVICGYDFIGQFNDDVDDEELWIIAHGMIIMWNSSKLNSVNKLKERLTTKDFNSLHSPANLLDKLMILRKSSLIEIRNLTVDYSFNDFTGFN